MGELLPTATDNQKGLLPEKLYQTLNNICISTGVQGGGQTSYYKIGEFAKNKAYNPIWMTGAFGSYRSEHTDFNARLTFSDDIVYKFGSETVNGRLGYVVNGSLITLFFKLNSTENLAAILVGGSINNTEHTITTVEPNGIVYF